jgi:hypothetical protein
VLRGRRRHHEPAPGGRVRFPPVEFGDPPRRNPPRLRGAHRRRARSQTARPAWRVGRPPPGLRRQVSRGLIDGSGRCGTRRSPPQRNSVSVGIGTLGSRRPGMIGCTFRKPSPAQRGDAFIRSSRAPCDLPPNDFTSPRLQDVGRSRLPGRAGGVAGPSRRRRCRPGDVAQVTAHGVRLGNTSASATGRATDCFGSSRHAKGSR